LYQSSGLRGRSQVLVGTVDGSGVSARYHFEPRYFAEGLTIVGEHAMVLTWKAGELFVLDKSNLRLQYKLSYPGEGWGLAYDGQHLWLSDGSEHIARYTPDSMTALGSIEVHDERGPVRRINELEYARGLLYANIWLSPRLIAIDPNSGRVVAEWDLRGLLPKSRNFGHEAVANGIAYDPDSGHFWLTGKGWPLLYEVRLYGVDGHSSR
jgi:glutamine cyclotransferase